MKGKLANAIRTPIGGFYSVTTDVPKAILGLYTEDEIEIIEEIKDEMHKTESTPSQ